MSKTKKKATANNSKAEQVDPQQHTVQVDPQQFDDLMKEYKPLILTHKDYVAALTKQRNEGIGLVVDIVNDIVKTGGKNIQIDENADPILLQFISEVKSNLKQQVEVTNGEG